MENKKEFIYCRKCLLPQTEPYIVLNESGVCNICEKVSSGLEIQNRMAACERQWHKAIGKYRGKGKYDCMVMCSGGKDSTLSLYYVKKRYKMNPLAFTFDHGFENEEALANVKNATNALDIDWLYYKTDFMKEAFKKVLESKSKTTICHICAIWYIQLCLEMADKYGIKIIVGGWTKGQSVDENEDARAFVPLSDETEDFIKGNIRTIKKYDKFPLSIKDVVKKYGKRKIIISPHWFIDRTEQDMNRLKEELGWRQVSQSYPANTTNCLLNFLNVYYSLKNHGYTHYHVEMSKHIREGKMTRDKALEELRFSIAEELLDEVAKQVGVTLKNHGKN